ncbi:MAG: gliding motility-associated C-terminal domain-containing protein [Bacteroidales bacterium]|jgi:gliding motility-associated-like protein|nr:gliding motility-associated C-terminal domain-containing protein [Bacteroidales bacterium]
MNRIKITLIITITLLLGLVAGAQTNITMPSTSSSQNGDMGWFWDPGGPSANYGTNLNCTFTLCVPSGTTLIVNFSHESSITPFTLGTGDTLWIYDGTGTSNLIGSYVDQTSPGIIESSGNCLTFVMHTNDVVTGNGREAGWMAWYQYRRINPDTVRLGLVGQYSGTPISPLDKTSCNAWFFDSGGPSGNYGNNQDCYVRFRSDVGSYVHVEFSEFNVSAGDTLFIYDGINANARLIGKFTDANINSAAYAAGNWGKAPPKDIFSSGYDNGVPSIRALTFHFKSNSTGAGTGWKAKVTCADEIFHLDASASACPSVVILDENLLNSDTIRVDCQNTQLYHFEAEISVTGKYTNDYTINPIPYNPPYDLYDQNLTPLGMSVDDNWGPPTTLPFTFDFFGKHYTNASPGANGCISMDIYPNGHHFAYAYSSYYQACNNYYTPPDCPVPKNSIYCGMEDLDPSVTIPGIPRGNNIRFGVLGEYPCRTFVFSFWQVQLFGTSIYQNSTEFRNSYQMVMYEGTNIIEVHVRHRKCCASTNHNGEGIIGLQNSTGSQLLIVPGRGITPYGPGGTDALHGWNVLGETNESAREAWRFVPVAPMEYEIAWFRNDTNSQPISTVKYANVAADVTTNFICRIKYDGSNGAHYTVMDTVVFYLPPREIAIEVEDSLICPNASTQLTVTHPAAPAAYPQLYDNMHYLWSTGDTTQTITVTPGITDQTYSCTVTFADYCTRTAEQAIHIKALIKPQIMLNHEDVGDWISICLGTEVILTADSINMDSTILNWPTVGQGNVPSILVKPSQTKQYVLEATDMEGCTVRDTLTVEVTPPPIAAFIPTPDHVYVENGQGIVHFNNLSQNASSYYWLFGDKYSSETGSADFEPDHNYTRPGRYTIWLTATDSSDCRDSIWQTITVEVPYFLYVPAAFSPDGDGINEEFKPSGYGMDETVYEMLIYNRWGNLIYRTGSPYDSWDGHDRKGNECPTGEYIYIIKTQTLDLVPKEYKGAVLLMR